MNRKLRHIMNKPYKTRSVYYALVALLCATVAVGTAVIFINPADTAEGETFCGFEEHIEHTDACYDRILTCLLPEEGHTHTDTCYAVSEVPDCGLEETEGHQHTAACYGESDPHVGCGLEESEGHQHTEACYAQSEPFIGCGREETDGHRHGPDCYDETGSLVCTLSEQAPHHHDETCMRTEPVLICGMTEHTPHHHDETCMRTEPVLVCGLEECAPHQHGETCYPMVTVCGSEECEPHQHTDACYGPDYEHLICELPIHEHTLQCYSNPEADVETASVWEKTFARVELTGNRAEDVLAIAKTQIGYKESKRNYEVREDGKSIKGYTRYGDWYGNPCGDWCAMFCSFCLRYAGIGSDVMPVSGGCEAWINALSAVELYHKAGSGYEPKPGDLVFFNLDKLPDADHVAFIYRISGNGFTTIEGNWSDCVCSVDRSFNDADIIGFGELPEAETAPDAMLAGDTQIPAKVTIESAPAADGAVAVITGALPAGAEAVIEAVHLSEEELIAYVGAEQASKMRDYVAYDIKIMVGGVEWKPDESVSVIVRQNELTAAENENFAVAHVDDTTNEVADISGQLDGDGEISFNTEGFSLYIFYTYTVDFHYGELTFSIGGQSSIRLSELFAELGIEEPVAEVLGVSFTEDTLLRVQPTADNDWLLTSLAAFSTEEILTVTFIGGRTLDINVTDAGETPAYLITGHDVSLPFTVQNPNDSWQIVKEQYAGSAISNKTPIPSDPKTRIQKNVVPTGVENEFIVYLSASKTASLEDWFKQRAVELTTFKRPGAMNTLSSNFGGNKSYLYPDTTTGSNLIWTHVVVYDHANISVSNAGVLSVTNAGTKLADFYQQRSTNTSKCSNGSVLIPLPEIGQEYDIQYGVNFHDYGNGRGQELLIAISLEDMTLLGFDYYSTQFDTVEDQLGPNVEFIDFVYDEDGTCERNGDTLLWTITENPDAQTVTTLGTGNVMTAQINNVAQLAYRIRLKTETEGFDPCGEENHLSRGASYYNDPSYDPETDTEAYEVNDHAEITYHKVPMTGGNDPQIDGLHGEFAVPYVRGLRYDLRFRKINNAGATLPGAQFRLPDENGNEVILTSGPDGMLEWMDKTVLPEWVEEITPPIGYELPTPARWTITKNYTADHNVFEADPAIPGNVRFKGNDNGTDAEGKPVWDIINVLLPGQDLIFKKIDSTSLLPVFGVKFALYGSDESGAQNAEAIPGYEELISGFDGLFPSEHVHIPYGTYYLVEGETPAGYKPLEAVTVTVSASGVTASSGEVSFDDGVYTITVSNDRIDPTEPPQPTSPPQPADPTVAPTVTKQIDYLGDNEGVTGKENEYRIYLNVDADVEPIDLLLVVDQSYSMMDLLPNGKTRQQQLTEFLNGTQADHSDGFINTFLEQNYGNNLAVLTFGTDCSSGRKIVPWTHHDPATPESNVNSVNFPAIVRNAATNYTAALDIASDVLAERSASTNRKVMIFLSDGVPTLAYADGQLHHSFADVSNVVGSGGKDYSGVELFNLFLNAAYVEAVNGNNDVRQRIWDTIMNPALSDDAGNAYPGYARFVSWNQELGSHFYNAAAYDFSTTIARIPGMAEYPMGPLDKVVYKAWYEANWQSATDAEKLAWVQNNIPYLGNKYDLFYLTESAFYQFRAQNADVAVYTVLFGEQDGVTGDNRSVSEVLKYMSGNSRYYASSDGDALITVFEKISGIKNVAMTDPLSDYVELTAQPDLRITMDNNGYGLETNAVTVLYENGAYTPAGELFLDQANTGFVDDGRTLRVTFKPEHAFSGEFSCEASFNVRVKEYADEVYTAQGYDARGDAGTDHPGNATSSGKPGFWSNDNGNAKAEWTFNDVTDSENFPKPVVQVHVTDIRLEKIDAFMVAQLLADAEFDLYRVMPGGKVKINTAPIVSDASGAVTVSGLRVGSYEFVETKAPEGYFALTDPVAFEVVKDDAGAFELLLPDGAADAIVDTDDPLLLKIKDLSCYELPSTGGGGTLIYTLGGMSLMGAALMAGFVMRRKRERGAKR